MNPKQINDLNIRAKTIKLRRKQRGKSSLPQKVQVTKLKINRLDFIKVENLGVSKDVIKKTTHTMVKNISKAHN